MSRSKRAPQLISRTASEDDGQLNDISIRLALRTKLLEAQPQEPDTVLLEELGLCRGSVRVDIARVNGSLAGYEIKSDQDTLRRLSMQIEVYGKVLDRATLVVGKRLLTKALQVLPPWWGVLLVSKTPGGVRFRTIRRGRKNPRREPRALVELLWFEHALALLEQRTTVRGFRGKPRRVVWDKICDCFELDEIAEAVRSRL